MRFYITDSGLVNLLIFILENIVSKKFYKFKTFIIRALLSNQNIYHR